MAIAFPNRACRDDFSEINRIDRLGLEPDCEFPDVPRLNIPSDAPLILAPLPGGASFLGPTNVSDTSVNSSAVCVFNSSSFNLSAGAVLGNNGPVTPTINTEGACFNNVVINGVTPTTDHICNGNFVITGEAIENGKFGSVYPGEAIKLTVYMQSANDTRADAAPGITNHLVSGSVGPAEILWSSGGTGLQTAIVRLTGKDEKALARITDFGSTPGKYVAQVLQWDNGSLVESGKLFGGSSPSDPPEVKDPIGENRLAIGSIVRIKNTLEECEAIVDPVVYHETFKIKLSVEESGSSGEESGNSGGESSNASHIYTVLDLDDNELLTGVDTNSDPHIYRRSCGVTLAPATAGIAAWVPKDNGKDFELCVVWINEFECALSKYTSIYDCEFGEWGTPNFVETVEDGSDITELTWTRDSTICGAFIWVPENNEPSPPTLEEPTDCCKLYNKYESTFTCPLDTGSWSTPVLVEEDTPGRDIDDPIDEWIGKVPGPCGAFIWIISDGPPPSLPNISPDPPITPLYDLCCGVLARFESTYDCCSEEWSEPTLVELDISPGINKGIHEFWEATEGCTAEIYVEDTSINVADFTPDKPLTIDPGVGCCVKKPIPIVIGVRVNGTDIEVKTRDLFILPCEDESDWTSIHTGTNCPE